ncbi:hypothetical protein [Paenibacillus sp. sgz500958]|uniref:hypothetical protein n=1 Tax=Paenibacillus sp. sgz500958 TaxID=3242475 RepID=UPI0036D3883B
MMMRDTESAGMGTYEPFHLMLNDCRIADVLITKHAVSRYLDRISTGGIDEVVPWIWECLKQKRIKPYSPGQPNAYLIDDDVVLIAEFKLLEGEKSLSGHPLYTMIVVSFLGKISVTHQLRDLTTYYSWLRHSRRMKLQKKRRRKRK